MLTRLDLAVLRAALKFFDEEIAPHGRKTAQPYFDIRLPAEFDRHIVSDLLHQLRTCRPRYLVCDAEARRALTKDLLVRLSSALNRAQSLDAEVGTVLIPRGKRYR